MHANEGGILQPFSESDDVILGIGGNVASQPAMSMHAPSTKHAICLRNLLKMNSLEEVENAQPERHGNLNDCGKG
jgi:hypothetical protein